VVVVSKKIGARPSLCTVVALSTTEPRPIMQYNVKLKLEPPLPFPWNNPAVWVKGDMVYAVGFHRLDLIKAGKTADGRRIYDMRQLSNDDLLLTRKCLLHSLSLGHLTKFL